MTSFRSKAVRVGAMVAVGVLVLARAGNSTESVVPLSTHVHFSRSEAGPRWTQYVVRTSGGPAYVLTLQPDYDIGNYLAGVDLVLRRTGDQSEDHNLLSPPGNWHGPQRYNFMAWDLHSGVDKSIFGRIRNIVIKRLGLVVRIEVEKAVTSVGPHHTPPIPADAPELDELWLAVRVDNLG